MSASSEGRELSPPEQAPESGARAPVRQPLLVIVGPTAVGKTALSLRLAEAFDGEIVSADSRLFYRGMDIGTAKPSPEERSRIAHHLIDIADPDETVGLAQFHDRASAAITDIYRRHRLPLLVGGTGQYVRSIVEGWRIPRVPPDSALRRQLEAAAERDGAYALHARLAALDPVAAASIDARNVRRVVRALEVCETTGRPISEQRGKQTPPYRVLQIGLTMPRVDLYTRVDQRVDTMMATGLEQEVRELVERGYGLDLPAMSGLGYVQFRANFEGRASLDEVTLDIKRSTRRFIRRQYNWFRADDPAIRWFDLSAAGADEIEREVTSWLGVAPDLRARLPRP